MEQPAENERTYKILVVDDEPDVEPLVLQRMRRRIRSGRYSFVFAQNGVEALERLQNDGTIDMVVSDINMPQMDGLTLLQQIPNVDPDIRAVIISAYGDMKNIRTAMNRGAFDFVTKPIDFEDLEVTIDRTLGHIAQWREALSSRDKLVALQNELDVARNMQQSILPTAFPRGDDFEIYGSMEPARSVGGDFFDVVQLDHERVGVAIADVSGKGVPAALFMMSSRTLLKGSAIGHPEPAEVLKEVNDLLTQDNDAPCSSPFSTRYTMPTREGSLTPTAVTMLPCSSRQTENAPFCPDRRAGVGHRSGHGIPAGLHCAQPRRYRGPVYRRRQRGHESRP